MRPKRILIFYAKAGANHYSQAKLIQSNLLKSDPGLDISLIDILSDKPQFLQKLFTGFYELLTNKLYPIWYLTYFIYELRLFWFLPYLSLKSLCYDFLRKQILEYQPDLIIDTYFLPFVSEILEKEQLKIRFVNFVPDIFTPTNFAFYDKKAEYVVFSKDAEELARSFGVQKINQFPILIKESRLQSAKSSDFFTFSSNLGEKLPVKLLFLIGGNGFFRVEAFLRNLRKLDLNYQLTVVCGYNQSLKKWLEKYKQKNNLINWEILGFVDYADLIPKTDLILTKAGPATIYEIIQAKKPMIILSYIYKQELGNLNFVLKNNLGWYEPNPSKINYKIKQVLSSKQQTQLILSNLKSANLSSDNQELVNFLLK